MSALLAVVDDITFDEITPTRSFNTLYIILDSVFIVLFMALLIWKKRYRTAIFAAIGGIIYILVDYGYFYLISGTRQIFIDEQLCTSGQTFLILLWMSLSYGITNFAFIWVCVSRDKYWKEWCFLIVMWWLICPVIASLGGDANIVTTRTTGAYHGWMGVIMAVSYIVLIICIMYRKEKFVNVLILFAIGFAVQFGWEFALLINGIRPMNDTSIQTLIVDSCLETNLGMPIIYLIYRIWNKYQTEDLKRMPKLEDNVPGQMPTETPSDAPSGEQVQA